MSVSSYSFNSLLLKLPNKGINFPFPPLKLQNKEMEEYSKIIFLIHFHSILFPPKRGQSKSAILDYRWEALLHWENLDAVT